MSYLKPSNFEYREPFECVSVARAAPIRGSSQSVSGYATMEDLRDVADQPASRHVRHRFDPFRNNVRAPEYVADSSELASVPSRPQTQAGRRHARLSRVEVQLASKVSG
jgi:hypothetical protein